MNIYEITVCDTKSGYRVDILVGALRAAAACDHALNWARDDLTNRYRYSATTRLTVESLKRNPTPFAGVT